MYVGQFLLNFVNLLDHTANFLTLGDANETVSARTARARAAGQKWAKYACMLLTFLAKVVTFGQYVGDHCDYAINPKILPNSREIWDWDTMSFHKAPVTKVEDIEVTDTSSDP